MKQHIDIYNVLPGVSVPLKTYAARIGFKKLQDLPYEPDKILTQEQMDEVRDYCFNDIEITEALTYKMEKELEIRLKNKCSYNNVVYFIIVHLVIAVRTTELSKERIYEFQSKFLNIMLKK